MTMDEKTREYIQTAVRSAVLKSINENDDLAAQYIESGEYRAAVSDVIGWITANTDTMSTVFHRSSTGELSLSFHLVLDRDESHERISPDVV